MCDVVAAAVRAVADLSECDGNQVRGVASAAKRIALPLLKGGPRQPLEQELGVPPLDGDFLVDPDGAGQRLPRFDSGFRAQQESTNSRVRAGHMGLSELRARGWRYVLVAGCSHPARLASHARFRLTCLVTVSRWPGLTQIVTRQR